jgi:urease accessory protein
MLDLAQAPPTSRPVHTAPGRGLLRIIRHGSRSVADRVYATSPLRLLTPRNHGHAAWIYTSSYGGGLVDGDQISLEIEVERGAAAMVSTQASTKAYRSPRGTAASLYGRVGDEALLVAAPDPVVCFAGAQYRQVQQFDLTHRASLVVVDWVTCGRRTRGERWMFDEYRSELVVRVGANAIVHDTLALRASDGDLRRRLGRFNVLAVVLLAGAPLRQQAAAVMERASAESVEAAAVMERASAESVVRRADQIAAATPLGESCALLRIAGTSFEQVSHTVREYLAFLPAMLGDSPWERKW